MPGKENENYTLYDDGTFLIRGVRGSYVHVGKMYQGKPDKDTGKTPPPKYTFTALMPKSTHEKADKLVHREIMKLLKANGVEDIKADHKCQKDGNQAGKAEYRDMFTLNMSERDVRPPALRTIDNAKIDRDHMGDRKIDDAFQSGYWYDVLGKLWFQKDYGTKVNCNLLALKISKKDETFGQGGISDEDVDDAFGVSGDSGGFDDDDTGNAGAADDDL